MDINNIDQGIGDAVGGVLNTASGAVPGIIISVLVLGVVLLVFYFMLFRHKVRLRVLTNNGSVMFDDKAREIKVDGVPFWKLQKKKAIIPVPPSESLFYIGRDLFGKQKFYSEFYFTEEDGFIPIVDRVNKDSLRERLKTEISGFYPFRPTERALLVAQLRKAEARRKKSLLDQIAQIAVPLALVFVAIIGLVFWEDIAKPGKEIAELNSQMMTKQTEMMKVQAEIANQNARMVQALTGKEVPVNQVAESLGGGS